MNKQVVVAMFTIIFVIAVVSSSYVSFAKASNETESLNAANSSINQAFANVLAAEEAGANVTEPLAKLNDAGSLLAQADNSYHAGNLANVISDANKARSIANQVNTEAISIRDDTITRSQNSLLLTLLFSLWGALIFVVVVLLVWRRFKRHYMEKMLNLKPTGVENTT